MEVSPLRGQALQMVANCAANGYRLVVDGKTIWAGLGNRSGLHDYQWTVIKEKWEKSGERFKKKLSQFPAGTKVEVQAFVNITRDRGRWVKQSVYHI